METDVRSPVQKELFEEFAWQVKVDDSGGIVLIVELNKLGATLSVPIGKPFAGNAFSSYMPGRGSSRRQFGGHLCFPWFVKTFRTTRMKTVTGFVFGTLLKERHRDWIPNLRNGGSRNRDGENR